MSYNVKLKKWHLFICLFVDICLCMLACVYMCFVCVRMLVRTVGAKARTHTSVGVVSAAPRAGTVHQTLCSFLPKHRLGEETDSVSRASGSVNT